MSGISANYKELQYFNPLLYLFVLFEIIVFLIIASAAPELLSYLKLMVLLFWLLMAGVVNWLFMRTTIEDGALTVTFGLLFPMYIRRILLSDVQNAEPVRYSPMSDYGGWGIRKSGERRALNARGDLGVLLTLKDGTTLLVGTQTPHELANIVDSLLRTYPRSTR